jgi:hypothetical protein
MTSKTLAALVAVITLATTALVAGVTLIAGAASACPTVLPTHSPSASPPASAVAPEPSADAIATAFGCTSRVLARAATWLTAWQRGPVPYLSSNDPATWFDGYRRDCSGYASMALNLPGPGPDTAALAARSTPVTKADLHAGDLLINPAPGSAGHVVIFDRWTDTTMTSYLGYEQSGDGGTHHRIIPYPYFGDYPMSPYRWVT